MVPQHTDREAPRLPPPPGQRGDKAPDNAKHQVPRHTPNRQEIVINNPTQYSIFLRKVTPQSQLNISEEDGKDNLFLIQFFQGASFTFLCPMRYFFPIDFFCQICAKKRANSRFDWYPLDSHVGHLYFLSSLTDGRQRLTTSSLSYPSKGSQGRIS